MLERKAYAKINLTLEVLGRRDDGYHDVVSVMQTVDLADDLTFEPAEGISMDCDVPELQADDNLVLQAARALQGETGTSQGVRIGLRKGIPHSAGLGGGSSDAAATLLALDRLWGLEMPTARLSQLAARLGSDVPFFLRGGTALIGGRGERVRPLPPADLGWLVVLAPVLPAESPAERKTASMYSRLTASDMTRGSLTRKLAARIGGGGDVPPQFMFNVFDSIAFEAFPGLDTYWNTFHSLGAREIHLAGSGPSMFAPVSRREVGTTVQLMLERVHGWRAILVRSREAEGPGPRGSFWRA